MNINNNVSEKQLGNALELDCPMRNLSPASSRRPPDNSPPFQITDFPETQRMMENKIKEEQDALIARCEKEKRSSRGKDLDAIRSALWLKYRPVLLRQYLERQMWRLSERSLDILRTKTILAPQVPLDCLPASFRNGFKKHSFPELHSGSPLYVGPNDEWKPSGYEIDKSHPSSRVPEPNDYFIQVYPHLVESWGLPFYSVLERRRGFNPEGEETESIYGMNTLFFAAVLAGDRRLGHDLIYYSPEKQFYFFDVAIGMYVATSEAKVKMLLLHTLQSRAWGQKLANTSKILEACSNQRLLLEIIDQAKAVLATGADFFEGDRPSRNDSSIQRGKASLDAKVAAFVDDWIEERNSSTLTVTEVLEAIRAMMSINEATAADRDIRLALNAAIRQKWGRGLRHDLTQPEGGCRAGWKGLSLKSESKPELLKENQQIRESGSSVSSGLTSTSYSADQNAVSQAERN